QRRKLYRGPRHSDIGRSRRRRRGCPYRGGASLLVLPGAAGQAADPSARDAGLAERGRPGLATLRCQTGLGCELEPDRSMTRPGRFVLLLPLLLAAQPVNGAPAAAPSAASGAGAPTVAPSAAVAAFDQFIARSGPLCAKQASGRCVDAGLAFADRDADGRLSVDELESLHREMKAWLAW